MTDPIPFEAHARVTDPETSQEAADSVRNYTRTHHRMLDLLALYGPLTDSTIRRLWDKMDGCPPISDSGLRSRRNELVKAGRVVDTGHRVRLESGRRAVVWGLATVARAGDDA